MMLAAVIILSVQVITFVALGILFMCSGQTRLGIAQILLALVQIVIYTEGITS